MIDREEVKKYIERAHNKELLKILLWVVMELVWRWDEDDDKKKEEVKPAPNHAEEIPLEDLDISVRTFNCLKRVGVETLEQVYLLPPEQLWNVRNLGRRGAIEIVKVMKQYGYDYEECWNIDAEKYERPTVERKD